jgi:transcriptional regulator with GAF, ATPase, and Fis domain
MDVVDQMLIGNSPDMRTVRELIRQVANSDLNVVISGESGVGKELVAQALHLMSPRRDHPFVKVNCAAIPSELLESELFGFERGAFTGADRSKMGKFEVAHKGTMLLDEIGDMPLFLQSKMLQVLQDFQFSRLGAKKDVKVDCWVLGCTNRDLEQDVKDGLFREDLYYRLNIISIFVPPLRERPEDIDILIDYFAAQCAHKVDGPFFEFTNGVRAFLRDYSWPGNVREVKNTVERLMLLQDWETVREILQARETKQTGEHQLTQPSHPMAEVPKPKERAKRKFPPLKSVKKEAIRKAEGELIAEVLKETHWNRKKAAQILEISYKALLYKIKDLDLQPDD